LFQPAAPLVLRIAAQTNWPENMLMPKALESKQGNAGASPREAVETTSEVFPDGTALELIRLDSEAGDTSLLRWDGSSATVAHEFEARGKVYRPPQVNSRAIRALRLPGGIAPYGSTRDLFHEIMKLFAEYTDLAESDVRQLAYFVLASWLVDQLLVAPLLLIIAPLGGARAQLLRLLSSLCRRSLMLDEVSPAAVSRLAELKPTLVFDEPTMTRRAGRFLYTTSNYGDFALGNGRIMGAPSAKVICSQEALGDTLLTGQTLEIAMTPTGREVPFLEIGACEQIGAKFQAKLLHYRLSNLGKIRPPEFDVSELPAQLQDAARALAASAVDDPELQLGVFQLLRERSQDAHLDASAEFASAILEGLLFCCHREGWSQVLSGELADIVNTIWENRGEGRTTTPESVGWKLRALGLRTEPLDGAGKGLRLTEAIRAKIHSLAKGYRVRQAAQADCPHCRPTAGKQ
jgi:hypothetical protein